MKAAIANGATVQEALEAQTEHNPRESTANREAAVLDMSDELAQHNHVHRGQETPAESGSAWATIHTVLESITDAFFSLDNEWRFTYVNKEAERLMRHSREALLGKNLFEVFPEASGTPTHLKYREVLDSQTNVEYETYYEPFEAWYEVNACPSEAGGLSVYFRDITGRKRTDAERLRLATIVESSDDAILSKTLDGVITSWNLGAQKMYGYTAQEAIGRSIQMLLPDDRKQELSAILEKIRKGERVEPFETVRVTKTGEQLAISVRVSPILDDVGSVVGASAIARDITAHKRAEYALRTKDAHFRSIVMSLQEGLVVQAADGGIIDCNEVAEQILGLTRDQMIGRTSMDPRWRALREDGSEFPGEDHPSMVSLRTHLSCSNVVMGVHKPDGVLTWIRINSNPIFHPGEDAPYAVATTFRDITEMVKVEEQVRIQAQVLDQVQAGIIVTNMEGQVTHWNAYAEKLYGWQRDEAVGVSILDLLIVPPDLALAGEVMGKVFTEGHWEGEFPIQHKDGTIFPAYVIDTLIRDSKGAPLGVAGVSIDIRERKESDKQLQRQIDHLAALRTIDMVITSSLDLRISLNVILEQVTSQLQVDAAAVLLLNPHTRVLECAAYRGFRNRPALSNKMSLGQGFAGRAALERRIVHVPDLRDGKQPLLFATTEKEDFTMYYAVPLIARGQVQGVLEILHRAPMSPDAEWLGFAEALAGQTAIAIDNSTLFEDLQRTNMELVVAYDTTLQGWSRALDLRDKETEGHTQRVTDMALRLAQGMNVAETDLLQIHRGALLHDIGKMGIPDSILLKPGPLTDEEWEIMRKHPVYAYELLSSVSFLRPALDIPYCHHEKWDGTGYPRGLKGEQIPLSARIFAVVDVYDALSSDRPYRPAWPQYKVLAHIREGAGTHFDPKVVEVFLGMQI
ncbi:MAG TPA: PAS domain S-box protein [Chloroflexia bacterium]|jgi:PAS domain S-box-containing protein